MADNKDFFPSMGSFSPATRGQGIFLAVAVTATQYEQVIANPLLAFARKQGVWQSLFFHSIFFFPFFPLPFPFFCVIFYPKCVRRTS